MRTSRWLIPGAAVVGLGLACLGSGRPGAPAAPAAPAPPSIEGNYVLDYRELPDGTKVRAPDVAGMMTFTKDRRNFNVYWKEKDKTVSIGIVSRYTLSAKEYTEENVYFTIADGVGGKAPVYDLSSAKGSSPVTVKDGRIQFQLPLHSEPEAVFEKGGLTATRTGDHGFVDHWKKID